MNDNFNNKYKMDKISYALGLSIGNNFQSSGIDKIVSEDFIQGLQDVLQQKEPVLSYEEAKQVINHFFVEVQENNMRLNKEAGEEFLKINGLKEGVVTLPSGVQYEVAKTGDGPKPTLKDTVRCHYHGTLINGTVFDSSMDRGEPAEFPVSGVIAGWTEVLQLMSVGSKWKVTIPSHLAYGERGAGQMIQPNSTLIFIIELLDIVK
ncbi:FKBP-type 22 kDa peptidyl-prolyl cis-trans isomerase [Porphyromonas macacae]|uniref:Peptidyl-prolyl cis-trans isomerase n=2 Tax=Porphyromonas macacae TaxID=28115 RepID=A0A379EB99_9PORP|nr:FKBP-type 22 kDa peptidyl-prolyl cis-trans isomerase [Porphyromonas macacae]